MATLANLVLVGCHLTFLPCPGLLLSVSRCTYYPHVAQMES